MFNVNATPVFVPSAKEAIHWLMAAYREAGFPRQRIVSVDFDVTEEPEDSILPDGDRIYRGWIMYLTVQMRYWTIRWSYGVEHYSSWVTVHPEKEGQRYQVMGSYLTIMGDTCSLPIPEVFKTQEGNFQELEVVAHLLNSSELVFIRAEDYMKSAETLRKPRYWDADGNPVKVIHAWAVPKLVYTSGLINQVNDAFYSIVECPHGMTAYSCDYKYVDYGVTGKPWMLEGEDPQFQVWDGVTPSFGANPHWWSSYDSPMDRWFGSAFDEPNPLDRARMNVSFPVIQIMFAERMPCSVTFVYPDE
jgi:hypothetical protein